MVAQNPLLAVAWKFHKVPRSNGSRKFLKRWLATAVADSTKLPLAGIRVLDMTRVLAGVCHLGYHIDCSLKSGLTSNHSPIVLKFLEILGMR